MHGMVYENVEESDIVEKDLIEDFDDEIDMNSFNESKRFRDVIRK